MTFIQKLQAHENRLVRINEACRRANSFVGEIGMICDIKLDSYIASAWVTLLVDRSTHHVFIFEEDVEFL